MSHPNMIKKILDKTPLLTDSFRNSAILSVLFNALGKGIYFLSMLLIGRILGANAETDVYFFTLSFIAVIVGFSGFINSDVLIPRIIYLRKNNTAELNNLISFFYTIYSVLGLLITAIILIFPKSFLGLFAKFTPEVVAHDYMIFAFLFPTLMLNILMGLQSAILTAYNHFVVSSLVVFIGNCVSFLLFFGLRHVFGIQAAILGLVVGGLLVNIILGYYIHKFCQIKIKPIFKIDISIFMSIEYVTLSYVAFSLYSFALIYLMSTTIQSTLTAYTYAQLLAFIPYQFIAIQLTTIMANKFAELYNNNDFDRLKELVKKTLLLLTVIVLPICVVTIFLSTEIMKLVAGKEIHNSMYTDRFTLILQFLAIPAYFNSIYLCAIRLYTTTLRIKTPSIVQAVMCFVLLICNYIGLKYFNVIGFGLANLFAYGLMLLVAIYLIRHFFKILDNEQKNIQTQELVDHLVTAP